jgi:FeS assembly protein IscX
VNLEADDPLTWDDSYAIARHLLARFPGIDIEQVSLKMIFEWTVALPNFSDDPQLADNAILMDIYQEWYEEVNPL